MRKRNFVWLLVGLALCFALQANLLAQEHPSEHPMPAEQPKHHAPAVTKEQLGSAIEAYVRGEMEKGGGTWAVEDKEAGTTLHLTLDRVHKDKLAMTAPDTYFACADFKNSDGHMYDLDVFMQGPDKDHLQVTDVSVHKQDGKERYTWKKEGGVWVKEPVPAEKE